MFIALLHMPHKSKYKHNSRFISISFSVYRKLYSLLQIPPNHLPISDLYIPSHLYFILSVCQCVGKTYSFTIFGLCVRLCELQMCMAFALAISIFQCLNQLVLIQTFQVILHFQQIQFPFYHLRYF